MHINGLNSFIYANEWVTTQVRKENKRVKIVKSMKLILDKCFDIDINNIKDKDKESLKTDMKSIKKTIKEAQLSACRACNKSSEMWRDYYFQQQHEIDSEFNNIDKAIIEEKINKLYKSKLKKIKDKDKLQNEKYLQKIKDTSIENVIQKEKKAIRDSIVDNEVNIYGKKYNNVVQEETKNIMKYYNTANVGALDKQIVQANWNRDKDKILSYEAKHPCYKVNTPYVVHGKNYKIEKEDDYYIVSMSFFSREGLETNNLKKKDVPLKFRIAKISDSNKTILDRIINKEYKQGTAQLCVNRKDKIEFSISFTIEKDNNEVLLDSNRTLGLDLGITNVVAMSIYDNNTKEYDYINYKYNVLSGNEITAFTQEMFNRGMTQKQIEEEIQKENQKRLDRQMRKFKIGIISGTELLKMRNTTEKRRNDLKIASKYAGHGRCGHGRKTRMKVVTKIGNKISRFSDTYNHKISKYIVDFAIKNNCGNIQMEDLTKATANVNEKMLKDWSYYDLQQKITYKAQQNGIKVKKVNPKYTSKRCSVCGCIHEDNRDCKNNQAKFECQVCGHKENADINASKNIAIPDIDKIIKDTEILHNKEIV